MKKKSIRETPSFLAGDHTEIREVLHPKNEGLSLPYSLAYAVLPPGRASKAHRLGSRSEVYVTVSGSGRVFIDGEYTTVRPGDVVHIPAGAKQYVENTADESLEFWCIVAPPWTADDEIVF